MWPSLTLDLNFLDYRVNRSCWYNQRWDLQQMIIEIRNYGNVTATDDINDSTCWTVKGVKMTDEKIKAEIISRNACIIQR